MSFIGRNKELALLERYTKKNIASLIVVKGRRRIGKSRLIEEFIRARRSYCFAGLVPNEKTTAQSERDEFASQLAKQGFPRVKADDWNELFWLLAGKAEEEQVVIFFDEISWMGANDPNFLGKLKNAWDQHFKKNPNLILILCGSASSWIEKNILSSTGFLGRITYTLTLDELILKSCAEFWGNKLSNISAYEIFKVLSVTGGVPRYLEEISPALTAEENIRNLCFARGSILADEFDRIFSNIFLRNSNQYKTLVKALASGAKEFTELEQSLGKTNSGRLLEYLEELQQAGFIKRDYTWHIKDGQEGRLSKFRLSDNYLRFYLKYIEKNKLKIERNSFDFRFLASLSGWSSIMGLQFENLVLNNREYIWQTLGIKSEDILVENPFFQRKTTKQKGCQIDYLIQTKLSTLYVCEIKFAREPVPLKVISEVQAKIESIKKPKHVSSRPILIHVNGVDDSVYDADYFAEIIDFSQTIEK